MKRQNVRKPAAKGSRPHLRKAQGGPSESIELSKDDDMAPDQSLLVSTSRRIGSVLGKIVLPPSNPLHENRPNSHPKKY